IEALHVAALCNRKGSIDEHLNKLADRHQVARQLALGAERRNERYEHDQASIRHQFGNLRDTANVLNAIGIGEAEISIEAMTHIVTIEQVGMTAERGKLALDEIGDSGLAGTRKASEPQNARILTLD